MTFSSALYWFGLVHAVAYAIAGAVVLIGFVTVKAHMMAKVMGHILQWHYARARWLRREIDQEPRP